MAGGVTTFDYQVLGAYSDQRDPLTMTTVFRHMNITFAPNVTATSIDPDNVQANPQNEALANYNFNSQLRAINFSNGRISRIDCAESGADPVGIANAVRICG